MVTRTGEQEISAVSWRLLDNLGELACMTYMYFIKLSEHLAKKLIEGVDQTWNPTPPPS